MKKLLAILVIVLFPAFAYAGPSVSSPGGSGLDQTTADTLYAPIAITGDVNSVLDDTTGAVPVLYQASTAFTSGATEPSVAGSSSWKTANLAATTINSFSGGLDGQKIWVSIGDANTTFDFTSSDLVGYSADQTCAEGDLWLFKYNLATLKWQGVGPARTWSSVTISGGTAKTNAAWDASGNLVSESGVTIEVSGTSSVATKPGRLIHDTTGDQLVLGGGLSGTTEIVVGGATEFMTFIISGVTSVDPDDDHYGPELPYGITIKEISAIQRRNAGAGGTGITATINVQECTTALSCTDMIATDWILSGSTTAWIRKTQPDLSDSVAAKGNSLKLDIVSGASNSDLTVTIKYWINRE